MELLGERIVLREHTGEDGVALAAYQGDPRYLQLSPPEADLPVHAQGLVDRFVAWARERPRRNYQLAITHRGTGLLIGSCGLRGAGMAAGSAEFGLELAPDWWGRGLATEASRILLRFGFETLALEEILGVAVSENTRVARLVRELGFVERGTRAGDAWMQARGWSFTEWLLTREAWARAAPY